jgi:hypothetical protein
MWLTLAKALQHGHRCLVSKCRVMQPWQNVWPHVVTYGSVKYSLHMGHFKLLINDVTFVSSLQRTFIERWDAAVYSQPQTTFWANCRGQLQYEISHTHTSLVSMFTFDSPLEVDTFRSPVHANAHHGAHKPQRFKKMQTVQEPDTAVAEAPV